jgi:hypothetical protein
MSLIDTILEIRHLIHTDREAMISTGLTSLTPAVELMGDHLKFIDGKLIELTTKEETHGTE